MLLDDGVGNGKTQARPSCLGRNRKEPRDGVALSPESFVFVFGGQVKESERLSK
jgi:hypothetical protein